MLNPNLDPTRRLFIRGVGGAVATLALNNSVQSVQAAELKTGPETHGPLRRVVTAILRGRPYDKYSKAGIEQSLQLRLRAYRSITADECRPSLDCSLPLDWGQPHLQTLVDSWNSLKNNPKLTTPGALGQMAVNLSSEFRAYPRQLFPRDGVPGHDILEVDYRRMQPKFRRQAMMGTVHELVHFVPREIKIGEEEMPVKFDEYGNELTPLIRSITASPMFDKVYEIIGGSPNRALDDLTGWAEKIQRSGQRIEKDDAAVAPDVYRLAYAILEHYPREFWPVAAELRLLYPAAKFVEVYEQIMPRNKAAEVLRIVEGDIFENHVPKLII